MKSIKNKPTTEGRNLALGSLKDSVNSEKIFGHVRQNDGLVSKLRLSHDIQTVAGFNIDTLSDCRLP